VHVLFNCWFSNNILCLVSWYEYCCPHYILYQKLHSFNIHGYRIKTRRLYPQEHYVRMLHFPKYFPHINYIFLQYLQESRSVSGLVAHDAVQFRAMYIVTAHCICCSFHHFSSLVIDLLFPRTQLWRSSHQLVFSSSESILDIHFIV